MEYAEALDYLQSLMDYEKKTGYSYSPESFDLRRPRALLALLGNPQERFPAVVVAGTVSYQKALAVIVFFVIQQQIENHVLVPKVMERQVGISAIVVIVSVLIGGKLLGIAGVLLAVPSAAILQVLVMELLDMREADPKARTGSSSRA